MGNAFDIRSVPAGAFVLTAVVEVVDIAEVRRRKAEIMASCFTEGERMDLADRPAASVAGALAVKRAAIKQAAAAAASCSEQDVVLRRDSTGALRLRQAPAALTAPTDGKPAPRIRISVSHTRGFAAGLVVFEWGQDG